MHAVPAVSLKRPLASLGNLMLPLALAWAVIRSVFLIARVAPHVVVGTGGYISLPTCLAAVLTRRPLVVQEQNAAPGKLSVAHVIRVCILPLLEGRGAA